MSGEKLEMSSKAQNNFEYCGILPVRVKEQPTKVATPCNNFNVCVVIYDLWLLQGDCMIVLHQSSQIALADVAAFCCNTVARWVYARLKCENCANISFMQLETSWSRQVVKLQYQGLWCLRKKTIKYLIMVRFLKFKNFLKAEDFYYPNLPQICEKLNARKCQNCKFTKFKFWKN